MSWSAVPVDGQQGALAHFFAPEYPPLARHVLISGQVTLELHVAPDGKLTEIKERASSHPLLLQAAKAAVEEWEFQSWSRPQMVTVTMFFAFSGKSSRENPKTVVRADFAYPAGPIRVYITTDGAPQTNP